MPGQAGEEGALNLDGSGTGPSSGESEHEPDTGTRSVRLRLHTKNNKCHIEFLDTLILVLGTLGFAHADEEEEEERRLGKRVQGLLDPSRRGP